MKRLILLSLGWQIWLTGFCQNPMYQADFYFEDALGNRDTVTIGYDTTANDEFNPQFGEVNLTQPFDSVFEVRATQRTGFNWGQPPYILSKKVIDLGENYINLPQCYGGGTAICFIHAKYPPVTISWDITIMDNLCNRASFWSPDKAWELVDPLSWLQLPGIRHRCASKYESYTIQLGEDYKAQTEISYIIKHAVEGSASVKDTIYGVCFSGFWADWWISPCSLVDTAEPLELTENLVLFPNPAFDKISLQNEINQEHWIQLFESTGRMVKSIKRQNCEASIDVSSLRAGWYVLRTVDKQGQSRIGSFQKL
jgi:Secretion system C-terminal sorting domain